MKRWIAGLALSTVLMTVSALSQALSQEDQARITRAVYDHVMTKYPNASAHIELTSAHQAVADKPCTSSQIEITAHHATGRIPIRIRCGGSAPWSYFMTAVAEVEVPAVTAARLITRGETIKADMLQQTPVRLTRSHRTLIDRPEQILGKTARRTIQAHTPIDPRALSTPAAVEKGDEVLIVAQSGSARISMPGRARQSGQIGDQISVENIKSARMVRAWIVATGKVSTRPQPIH